MSFPLAYLLTWTTYGTWLPGDERSSVTHGNNRYGAAYSPPDASIRTGVERSMKHKPVRLTPEMRDIVDQTIREHCDLRGWTALAVNVRTNHAHAVISGAIEPETIMSQFKAWGTRRLRESGQVGADRPVWTRHGSTRYLWDERSVEGAVHYVLDYQEGRRFGESD